MKLARAAANYGHGTVDIDDEVFDATTVERELHRVFADPDYRPPTLPRVALEVMSLTRKSNIDFSVLVDVIESDQMVAAQVLKVAQSPRFAGASPTTTLHGALTRLGLRGLEDVVFAVALTGKVFRVAAYQPVMDSLSKHSLAVAHVARIVARYTSIDSEYAYLCGLLHDIGIAGGLIALADDVKAAPPLEDVWPGVYACHTTAGARIATLWGFPPDVAFAIGGHHSVLMQGHAHPMAGVIHVADLLAHTFGEGVVLPDGVAHIALDERPMAHALTDLDIDAAKFAALKEDVKNALHGLHD